MDEKSEFLNSPDARKMADANSRAELAFSQALWYAWGRIDSGQYQGFSLDVFKFANIVKRDTLSFELEQTFHLESIQDAWQRFVEAESS